MNAPAALLNKFRSVEDANYDPFAETRRDKSIASRQNDYQQKRLTARQISPERIDPFAGGKSYLPYKSNMRMIQVCLLAW